MGAITVIDADCILANLLQDRDQVTMRDVNRVSAAIEKAVCTVYVDVATNCLIKAVKQYPRMFAWEGYVFRRLQIWSQSYVDEVFNWRIPDSIRDNVLATLRGASNAEK